VDLSRDEIDALVRVLDLYLPMFRVEVHRTDMRELKHRLEEREALLSRLRERLQGALQPGVQ
jgi:hypothetical protein